MTGQRPQSVFSTHTYDGTGRRIKKAVINCGDIDTTEYYYYAGPQMIETRNGSENATRQFVFGAQYVDEPIRMDADTDDDGNCLDALGSAEHLAHAMGVPVSGQLNTSRTVHRILHRLTGSHRLLILDEAHLLRREAMTLARQIHDASGCPVVLAGVPGLLDRILAGRGDRMQGATLYSRVGLKYDLAQRCIERGEPLYSLDDVRAFFESLKLVVRGTNDSVQLSGDALQWLQAVACLPVDD